MCDFIECLEAVFVLLEYSGETAPFSRSGPYRRSLTLKRCWGWPMYAFLGFARWG